MVQFPWQYSGHDLEGKRWSLWECWAPLVSLFSPHSLVITRRLQYPTPRVRNNYYGIYYEVASISFFWIYDEKQAQETLICPSLHLLSQKIKYSKLRIAPYWDLKISPQHFNYEVWNWIFQWVLIPRIKNFSGLPAAEWVSFGNRVSRESGGPRKKIRDTLSAVSDW